jgi:hypothetical protein
MYRTRPPLPFPTPPKLGGLHAASTAGIFSSLMMYFPYFDAAMAYLLLVNELITGNPHYKQFPVTDYQL